MDPSGALRLHGGLGSPYTMKMRAYLRYRRIPHRFCQMTEMNEEVVRRVRPAVIPVLEWPDGRVANDSTLLIDALEREYADRSALPVDLTARFLALFLEDFADEWGTKWMFDSRWARSVDQETCSRWIAYDRYRSAGRQRLESLAGDFRDRQVSRMPIVGCTMENRPVLDASLAAVTQALDVHLADHRPFLFGSRPSVADFALYGQLSQLASDPSPSEFLRTNAPYVARWVLHVDDLSGVEGEWDSEPSAAARVLIRCAADIYLPFLAANAEAVENDRPELKLVLMDLPYVQAPFRYQLRCLTALRSAFRQLGRPAQTRAADLLGPASSVLTEVSP